MSDQDVFTNKPKEEENSDVGSVETLLANIKNDKGEQKYADVAAALKALENSQDFIPSILSEKKTVEEQLKEAQEELKKRQTLEELAEALKSKTPAVNAPETKEVKTESGVSQEDLDKLLEQKLNQRDQAAAHQSNLKSVVDALTSKYGDKTSDHIQSVAQKLGTTSEKLKEMASENPTLALRLLDDTGSVAVSQPLTSKINAPRTVNEDNPAPTFERGATKGGMTGRELADRWNAVGKYTNKRIGVED